MRKKEDMILFKPSPNNKSLILINFHAGFRL
jgi:hypothetical protein